MKKKIFIFTIFTFFLFCVPLNVRAEQQATPKSCDYKQIWTLGNPIEFLAPSWISVNDDNTNKVLVRFKANWTQFNWTTEGHWDIGITLDQIHTEKCPKKICCWHTDVSTAFLLGMCKASGDDCTGILEFGFDGYAYEYSDITIGWTQDYTGALYYAGETWLSGCGENIGAVKLLKIGYDIVKIAAPIALVLFASIDLLKAVTSADDSKIKKAQSHILKRFVAAVIVFLAFVIIQMVAQIAGDTSCIGSFFK